MTYRLYIREPNFKDIRRNVVLVHPDCGVMADVSWASFDNGVISYTVEDDPDDECYLVEGELIQVASDDKLPGEP